MRNAQQSPGEGTVSVVDTEPAGAWRSRRKSTKHPYTEQKRETPRKSFSPYPLSLLIRLRNGGAFLVRLSSRASPPSAYQCGSLKLYLLAGSREPHEPTRGWKEPLGAPARSCACEGVGPFQDKSDKSHSNLFSTYPSCWLTGRRAGSDALLQRDPAPPLPHYPSPVLTHATPQLRLSGPGLRSHLCPRRGMN